MKCQCSNAFQMASASIPGSGCTSTAAPPPVVALHFLSDGSCYGRHGAAPGNDVWVCEGCGPVQCLLSLCSREGSMQSSVPPTPSAGAEELGVGVQEAQCCIAVQQWALHRAVLCCMPLQQCVLHGVARLCWCMALQQGVLNGVDGFAVALLGVMPPRELHCMALWALRGADGFVGCSAALHGFAVLGTACCDVCGSAAMRLCSTLVLSSGRYQVLCGVARVQETWPRFGLNSSNDDDRPSHKSDSKCQLATSFCCSYQFPTDRLCQ